MVEEEASRLPGFAVGQRVVHGKRGAGVVSELMEDGRTRVTFDNGDEHRYAPESLDKLAPLDAVAAPASLGSSGGAGGHVEAQPSLWAASRGTLTAVDRMTSLKRPTAEGSLTRRRPNLEREEMLESEQIIEAEASKRRGGRRCSLSLKDRPERETSRKPRACAGSSGNAVSRKPSSCAGSSGSALTRKPSSCAGSSGSVVTPRQGKRVNLEREEMLESEQIIEQEATIRRGRRCSLSLKAGPGRETCRSKCSKMPSGTRPGAPRSETGSAEDNAATLARLLSARGLQQASSLHGVASDAAAAGAAGQAETATSDQDAKRQYVV